MKSNMMTCPIDLIYKPPTQKTEVQAKDKKMRKVVRMRDIFKMGGVKS